MPTLVDGKVTQMTQEDVKEMERIMIAKYKERDFQRRLLEAHKSVELFYGNDPRPAACTISEVCRARRAEVCRPVQYHAIERFGFSPDIEGLRRSSQMGALMEHDGEMDKNHWLIQWLTDPEVQAKDPNFVPDAMTPWRADPGVLNLRKSRWLVTAGGAGKGLVVRRGEDLDSPIFPSRLMPGAELEAMEEVTGNRLHYKRVSGDGPNFGWVSLKAGQNLLVVPDIPAFVRPSLVENLEHGQPYKQEFADVPCHFRERRNKRNPTLIQDAVQMHERNFMYVHTRPGSEL